MMGAFPDFSVYKSQYSCKYEYKFVDTFYIFTNHIGHMDSTYTFTDVWTHLEIILHIYKSDYTHTRIEIQIQVAHLLIVLLQ